MYKILYLRQKKPNFECMLNTCESFGFTDNNKVDDSVQCMNNYF